MAYFLFVVMPAVSFFLSDVRIAATAGKREGAAMKIAVIILSVVVSLIVLAIVAALWSLIAYGDRYKSCMQRDFEPPECSDWR
jgi:hypothetical protein